MHLTGFMLYLNGLSLNFTKKKYSNRIPITIDFKDHFLITENLLANITLVNKTLPPSIWNLCRALVSKFETH